MNGSKLLKYLQPRNKKITGIQWLIFVEEREVII